MFAQEYVQARRVQPQQAKAVADALSALVLDEDVEARVHHPACGCRVRSTDDYQQLRASMQVVELALEVLIAYVQEQPDMCQPHVDPVLEHTVWEPVMLCAVV